MAPYIVPLILAGIAILAFLSGNYVSKSMRMPDTGWKVTLLTATIGIALLILATNWPPKQGIDLKGGVILIYEVNEELTRQSARRQEAVEDATAAQDPDQEAGDVDMPGLVQALSRRINPGGLEEIVVRPYGTNQVEIVIPDVSGAESERYKKLITTGGFLKFQIVANRRDHSHIWSLADEPDQVGQYEVRNASGEVVGQWAKLALEPNSTPEEPRYRAEPPDAKSRIVRGRKEVLMVVDADFNLQGNHLHSIRKGYQDLSPAVFFDTTVIGAGLMQGLTESNLPDHTTGHFSLLGIVMDGELISAPRINSTISSSGVIEGNFTEEEVDLLVNVLRAGRLPAVLHSEPHSQTEISPLLGTDTIRYGKISIALSLVSVMGFMLVYYRLAGVVACLSLALNLILILALMIFVGAAFSLPGMAALILTVGMAVDANVLIYERMREEMRRGSALRMAIRNGFSRATGTIVDANITTLITAIVLYLIGTEQLRAFAIALILGILMTMYTGVFFAHVVIDLLEKALNLKKLKMMQMFADTNWDLFAMRKVASGFALALILVSIAAVAIRREKIFDIDFLGGTSVQILLKEPMPMAEVRERADRLRSENVTRDVSVTQVKSQEHGDERIYRIDTSLPSVDVDQASSAEIGSAIGRVKDALRKIFRDESGQSLLMSHSMTFAPATALASAMGATPPAGTPEITEQGPTPFDASGAPADSANPTGQPITTTPDASDPASDSATPAPADEATPGSNTPGEPAPPQDSGARADRPAETLLAYAPEILLAQADLATGTATDAAGAAQSPATAAPAIPSSTSPGTVDASALRSQSILSFDEEINADTLEAIIRETAQQLGLVEPDIVLTNDQWDGRSSKGYDEWTVQLSTTVDQTAQILQTLSSRLSDQPVWLSADQIGSAVAGDKTRLAIGAVIGSFIGIIAYLWFRFHRVQYGIAAVVAVIHDVLVTIGALALSYWLKDVFGFLMVDEFKINLTVLAALLTIIGYSLNDTIVIFDRIRELKGKSPKLTADIINEAINETMSRTILTTGTTLLAVIILYVIGGQGIHAFAYALLVGLVAGTYSTVFIASPVLLWLTESSKPAEVPSEKVTA